MSVFNSLDQVLEQRRKEQQAELSSIIARNAAKATTPETIAGTGIGNFLGALAAKYLNKPIEATEQELAAERARQGLFTGPMQNEMTPDGGMRSVPRELSMAEDLNYKADRFLNYAQQFGDKDAYALGMQFKQFALDEAQNVRKTAAALTPTQKLVSRIVSEGGGVVGVDEATEMANQILGLGNVAPAPTAPAPAETASTIPKDVVPGLDTATPFAAPSQPPVVGTNIVDPATVSSRVDSVLAQSGLTRETAPPDVVKRLEELEKQYRPYGN